MKHRNVVTIFATATCIAATAFGGVEYQLVIIEPWDTSYALASSGASGLNNLNQVSGSAYASSGPPQFLWTLETGKQPADYAGLINDNGVMASNGSMRFPDGTIVEYPFPLNGAHELTNGNVIAGGGTGSCSGQNSEAVVWDTINDPIRMQMDLGIFGADEAFGINDAMEVVGVRSSTGECGHYKAFYYDLATDTYIDVHAELGNGSSGISILRDINNAGVAIGDGPMDGALNAFTWSVEDGFELLPTIKGGDGGYTKPVSINDSGVIVGSALNFDIVEWRAVIWDDEHGVRDLNSLVELPEDFIIHDAIKINENGWILGSGFYGTWSPSRAVVLVPLDQGSEADLNGDGIVGVADLLMLLNAWGENGTGADLAMPMDMVDVSDLLMLLSEWG